MATFQKFEICMEHAATMVHNFNTDLLKVYLTNSVPNAASHTLKADLAEISSGNGYTAGGFDVQNAVSRSGGVTSVTGVDVSFTATGGSVGPFRYAVTYNDTSTSPADPLVSYWDYGSAITINDGEDFTIDFGSAIFTMS